MHQGRDMERAVFVDTTWPLAVAGGEACHALVEQRLAACVNILPNMVSVYRWEREMERGEEAVMIVKTRASWRRRWKRRSRQCTPSPPWILVLPLESVESNYLGWLLAETEASKA